MFIDQNVYNQCWETGASWTDGSSKVCLGQCLGYTKNEITKDQRQEWLGGSGGLPRNAALECTQKDKCFPRNRGKTFSDKGCCHMNGCKAIPFAKLLGAVSFQKQKEKIVELRTSPCFHSPSLRKPDCQKGKTLDAWCQPCRKVLVLIACSIKQYVKRKEKSKGLSLHPPVLIQCIFSISPIMDNLGCHLDTLSKRESQLNNFLHQVGLYAYLWGICLTDNRCRGVQHTVCSTSLDRWIWVVQEKQQKWAWYQGSGQLSS